MSFFPLKKKMKAVATQDERNRIILNNTKEKKV